MPYKKSLGLGSIVTGTFFLFNPNINILDILPDFIGYLFIAVGLTAVADINAHLSESRQRFLRLTYINLSRFPAFLLMTWITGNYVDERTSILVLAFAYAIVELIYLPGAYAELFEGLFYLGSRYDASSVFRLPKKGAGHGAPVSGLKAFTIFFMFAKLILPCTPYLVYLYVDNPYGVVSSRAADLERLRNPLIVLTSLIVLILGVIWLYHFVRYFKNVLRDKPFIEKITESYQNKITTREGLVIKRKIRNIIFVFCVAFALSPDIFLNDVNLIPDWAAAIFFFLGGYLLKQFTKKRALPIMVCSGAYFFTSLATYAASINFTDNFAFELLRKSAEARVAFRTLTILTLVEAVVLGILLFFVARALCEIAQHHAGYEGDTLNQLSSSQLPVSKILSRRLYISFGYGVAAALSSVLYIIFRGRTIGVFLQSAYIEPTYVFYPEIEMLWLYYLLISLLWVIYTLRVLRQLSDEVAMKYKYA